MKTVYVVGKGDVDIIKIINDLELSGEVKVVVVHSIEDVPLIERMKSDPSVVQEVHRIKPTPIFHEILSTKSIKDDEKRQSQQGWKGRNKYKR